jgi:hypothetical protein
MEDFMKNTNDNVHHHFRMDLAAPEFDGVDEDKYIDAQDKDVDDYGGEANWNYMYDMETWKLPKTNKMRID